MSFPAKYHIRCAVAILLLLAFGIGCATPSREHTSGAPALPWQAPRRFDFAKDTFHFPNELVWEYQHHTNGQKTTVRRRQPPPTYFQRCFVVSRAARQFYDHARFDPSQPASDRAQYERLIRQVVSRSTRRASAESERVVIPGYSGLRSFSRDWESLLKQECGGAWRSYVQRGNWRMVLPFTRRHQHRTATVLSRALQGGRPEIVHIVRFPQLTINHALLVYDVTACGDRLVFTAYDPNNTTSPAQLVFDQSKRSFWFPSNDYFVGGPVDLYRIYRGCCY